MKLLNLIRLYLHKKPHWVIGLLFFIPALLNVIFFANPFCSADDWRFIDLFLIPFKNGNFNLGMLWGDPVHPKPFTVILLLINMEVFDLQINYISFFGIFFQFLGYIIISHQFIKSQNRRIFIYFYLILIATIWFNFSYHTPYTWYLVTLDYIDFFLIFVLFILSNNQIQISKYSVRSVLFHSLFNLFISFFTLHQAIIANVSVLIFSLFLYVNSKDLRKKILFTNAINLVSLMLSVAILSLFLPESQSTQFEFINSIQILIANFSKTFQSMGIALLSTIFNIKRITSVEFISNNLDLFSLILIFFFFLNIFLFFKKEIFKISLLPGLLMFYTLFFMGVTLLKRYNPTQETGIFCLNWPRYIIEYCMGSIGIIWNIALLNKKTKSKHLLNNKTTFALASLVCGLFILNSITNYKFVNKDGNHLLNSYYPSINKVMKTKDIETIKTHPIGRNISQTDIDFLTHYSLNVYSNKFPLYEKMENHPNKNK